MKPRRLSDQFYPLTFRNLATGEWRTVNTQLWVEWCDIEWVNCYQLRTLDGRPAAEDAASPAQALRHGAWSSIPERQWGWTDVQRWGVDLPPQSSSITNRKSPIVNP